MRWISFKCVCLCLSSPSGGWGYRPKVGFIYNFYLCVSQCNIILTCGTIVCIYTCVSFVIQIVHQTQDVAWGWIPRRTWDRMWFKWLPFFYDVILKIKHDALVNVHVQLGKVLFSHNYLSHFTMISHAQTGVGTPSTTGWFEVEVNGKLVHSKKVRVDPLSLLYIAFTIIWLLASYCFSLKLYFKSAWNRRWNSLFFIIVTCIWVRHLLEPEGM